MTNSPKNQEVVTLDQGMVVQVESTVDAAVLEHTSGKFPEVVEQAETHLATASGLSSTPGILPHRLKSRSDPAFRLLGAEAAQIPLKLRTTIEPQSISPKILPPQPLAAVMTANDV